jgi:hypothetical protein
MLIKSALLLAIVPLFISCDGTLPKPDCPEIPAARDYGPPAAQSEKSSVNIDLSATYVRLRVREAVETKILQDTTLIPDNGVKVNAIRLEEKGAGANRMNFISIDIEPWLKGASGKPASLQRYYTLTLKIVPHLITAQSIPDSTRRKELLRCGNDPKCGESGVLLVFDFYELYSKSFSRKVECPSSDYDLIDARVLTGIYESLYGSQQKPPMAPLIVPAQQIIKIVSGLVGAPVNLTGVALGSDQDLRIALLMDQGSPLTFSSQTWLRPGDDWGVSIDTSFVASSIRRKVEAKAREKDPAISITVNLTFAKSFYTTGPRDDIIIDAAGSAPQGLCGVVNFSLKATAMPRVCRNANGRSVLQICEGPSKITPELGLWSGPCLLFKTIFTGGMAVANITTGTPLSCPEATELQFSAGPNDDLYATRIDTDGVFYIAGRSQLLDTALGRTPGGPACP